MERLLGRQAEKVAAGDASGDAYLCEIPREGEALEEVRQDLEFVRRDNGDSVILHWELIPPDVMPPAVHAVRGLPLRSPSGGLNG